MPFGRRCSQPLKSQTGGVRTDGFSMFSSGSPTSPYCLESMKHSGIFASALANAGIKQNESARAYSAARVSIIQTRRSSRSSTKYVYSAPSLCTCFPDHDGNRLNKLFTHDSRIMTLPPYETRSVKRVPSLRDKSISRKWFTMIHCQATSSNMCLNFNSCYLASRCQ